MRRDNLIFISDETMKDLVDKGRLKLLKEKKYTRDCKLEVKANRYYKICQTTDLVFMHIQFGYGVIINEAVRSVDRGTFNLVEILSEFYWYIDTDASVGKCSKLDDRDIARCIGSVMAYGNIETKLPTWCQVHHENYRCVNTWEELRLWCEKKHKKYHREKTSYKSHRGGFVVKDVAYFDKLFARKE